MYIYWFTQILFFLIVYAIRKIGGNNNSPNLISIMINYHYPGENRVITGQFSSMLRESCFCRLGVNIFNDSVLE